MRNKSRIDYLESIGLDSSICRTWSGKFNDLRSNAKKRGVGFSLSFEDYVDLALEANIKDPSMIGRSNGQYQMGRIGDTGNYELGNCRFITQEQNQLEMIANGGRASQSETKTGRTKETHHGVSQQSKAITGRTKKNHAGRASQAEKLSKSFVAIDLDGNQHVEKNLSEFCEKYGLDRGTMSKVLSGKRLQHKGWTGYYLEDSHE